MKIDVLKRINRALSPNKVDFSAFDLELNKLKKSLEETVNIQTVDDVKHQLEKFKNKIDLTPLSNEIEKIGQVFTEKSKEIQSVLDEKTTELSNLKSDTSKKGLEDAHRMRELVGDISRLQNEITSLTVIQEADTAEFKKNLSEIESLRSATDTILVNLSDKLDTKASKNDLPKILSDTQEKIDTLRTELIDRMNKLGRGGSMNRQIFIGNSDPLTRYTDINLKAGTNVTINFVNNDTTKKVDVTIASAGGPSGSTRSIESTAVSSTIGGVSGTDYVVIATAGVALTLPTAVGNTNLYTIKNTAASSVLVATTGGQTIDNDTNLILATRYTAVDLISDTANWNIT